MLRQSRSVIRFRKSPGRPARLCPDYHVLYALCAEREVGVHWVTMGGRYMGAWTAGAGPVQRRIRQYKALTDPAVCLRLAKQPLRPACGGS